MLYSNNFLRKFGLNVYSQNGEDGVIKELLRRLGIENGWVCEFGAWDGKEFSNTFSLIKKGFNGVYIEGDTTKYNDLLKTVEEYPNIIPINAFVDYEYSENSLDNLLKNTDIPYDFDILSIDVDSFDYQIWKSFVNYRPKIVIIEINSSINTDVKDHIHTPGVYQGTSFRPTFNLGLEKGYKFVLHTGNMIFIRNDLFDKLDINYFSELENFVTIWGAL